MKPTKVSLIAISLLVALSILLGACAPAANQPAEQPAASDAAQQPATEQPA